MWMKIFQDNSVTNFPYPDVIRDFVYSIYKKHGVNPGLSGFDAAIEAVADIAGIRG